MTEQTAQPEWPNTGPCPATDDAGRSICTRAEGHPSKHVL